MDIYTQSDNPPSETPFPSVLNPRRGLLVFHLAGQYAAFHLENVDRIIPMVELAAPPGLPVALEGVLNLEGVAIPVLRLDQLFGLPAQLVGLYSMLIIVRGQRDRRLAILVSRVNEILYVPEKGLLPIDRQDSFNGCAEATVAHQNDIIHVLSLDRILPAKEREVLSEFEAIAHRRLRDWEVGQP